VFVIVLVGGETEIEDVIVLVSEHDEQQLQGWM
jgi:hypothetical protein